MTGGCGRLPERRLMATALAAGGSGGVGGMAVTCYGCHGNCERRGLRCLATPPWPPPPPPRASLSKRPTENLRISPPRPTSPLLPLLRLPCSSFRTHVEFLQFLGSSPPSGSSTTDTKWRADPLNRGRANYSLKKKQLAPKRRWHRLTRLTNAY